MAAHHLLPVLALGSIVFFLIVEAIYNVFFHPLRHYPGPVVAKANRIYFTYHSWNGNFLKIIKQLHDQYGDVVRVAPDELSYIDGKAWQDIFGKDTLPRTLSKPNPNNVTDIVMAGHEDHRRLRKVQAPMFSDKALFEQEPYIRRYVDKLVSKLRKRARDLEAATVDLTKWYNYTIFDILGDLAFGDSFGCLESDQTHVWIANMSRSIKDRAFFELARRFPSPIFNLLRAIQPRDLKTSSKEGFSFASEKARERISQGSTERNDFTSYILKHNGESGMTSKEIETNASVLIIAGSETTATLLSGLTFHLLHNPLILDKLTQLIRSTFSSESDISVATVQQLEFFTACITEGFRMYPPVPAGVPRVTTKEGNIICGRYVPPETTVYVTQMAAYQSSRNFTDPDIFVPDRWMNDPPEKFANDRREVLQPFSVGPRNCIGRKLAYAEIRLVLARMLWNFDMELQPESKMWATQKSFKFWEKPPLMVKLSQRKI